LDLALEEEKPFSDWKISLPADRVAPLYSELVLALKASSPFKWWWSFCGKAELLLAALRSGESFTGSLPEMKPRVGIALTHRWRREKGSFDDIAIAICRHFPSLAEEMASVAGPNANHWRRAYSANQIRTLTSEGEQKDVLEDDDWLRRELNFLVGKCPLFLMQVRVDLTSLSQ